MTPTSPETIIANYTDVERETLAAYGKKMWSDFFPSPDSMPVQRHGRAFEYGMDPESQAIFTQCYDVIANNIGKIIMDPVRNFDANWQFMVSELKEVGAEEISAVMTNLIRGKVELWNRDVN
jgi:putative aldouronate transport system substrate-binding protein